MQWISPLEEKPSLKEITDGEFYKSEVVLIRLKNGDPELGSYQRGYDGNEYWEYFYNFEKDFIMELDDVSLWAYIPDSREGDRSPTYPLNDHQVVNSVAKILGLHGLCSSRKYTFKVARRIVKLVQGKRSL